jgi:hypothetical protein
MQMISKQNRKTFQYRIRRSGQNQCPTGLSKRPVSRWVLQDPGLTASPEDIAKFRGRAIQP